MVVVVLTLMGGVVRAAGCAEVLERVSSMVVGIVVTAGSLFCVAKKSSTIRMPLAVVFELFEFVKVVELSTCESATFLAFAGFKVVNFETFVVLVPFLARACCCCFCFCFGLGRRVVVVLVVLVVVDVVV